MKKQVLLTLVLVGALCTLASATPSLNPIAGTYTDTNTNGIVDAGDTILVDLFYTGNAGDLLSWDVLVAVSGPVSVSYAYVTDTGNWSFFDYLPGADVVGGHEIGGGALSSPYAPAGLTFEGIKLTWTDPGSTGVVTVALSGATGVGGSLQPGGASYTGDFGELTIPEPMTLSLLGLGGLALLRRRRA